MMNGKLITVAMMALLVLCACTRGKERGPSQQQPTAAGPISAETPTKPAATGDADADAWQNGTLPGSVLQGEPHVGGELVVGITTDPPALNPIIESDGTGSMITGHRIYEALIVADPLDDPGYRHMPELAERWEISPDNLTFTLHLRKGVRWHDGQPFTSRDVIATFDKIQDPSTKAVHVRSYTQELASYKAPDDFTVVLVWKRPYFLTLDTLTDIPIQPAHVIGKLTGSEYNEAAKNPLNRHPIGTGPFKFVSWENNAKIVLERNDDYWGKKPYVSRLLFRIQQDHTVMLQLAERGEIDMVEKVTSAEWMHMDSPVLKKSWNRSKFYSASYAWIGWNAERPLFSDKRVRRALTLLVDRPGIIQKMLFGLPKATTCHFYWASAACDPNLKQLPFDPSAAEKLLDEAGWKDTDGDGVRDRKGVPFRFVFMVPVGSSEAGLWVAKIKEDMGRVGIDMDIQNVEWSAFTKRLREHRFDACTLLWSGGPRGEPTQVWHSSSIKGGSNYVSYRNPETDKLMEDARVIFDPAPRDALFRKFGAILEGDQPYTMMYVRPELWLLHKKVKGARTSLMGWHFESMWIDPAWGAAK